MANWIVGGIVFLLLGLAAWHVARIHKRGECCGCCKNCSGCKDAKSLVKE